MDCRKVPNSAPLYNCPNGHIICSSCYKGSRSECPSCYDVVGSAISLIGLTIIEKIKHSCPYSKCTEKMDLEKIAEHKTICSFRPVECPATNCKTVVSIQNFHEHIKECKHSYFRNSRTIDATNEATRYYAFNSEELTTNLTWQTNTFHWKGEHFSLIVKANRNNKMTNAYIQMFGSSYD